MALSPKMLQLKVALESVGQPTGSSQDDILTAAAGWIVLTARDMNQAKATDVHSSGPQFDAPAKPKRTKKSS